MTDEPLVLYGVENGIGRLTLNRPDHLNAFTRGLHRSVAAVLERAADDGLRCLVITGAGRGFCTGQDLEERRADLAAGDVDLGESLRHFYNPLIARIQAFPAPVIAAVNGPAAGAGVGVALASDIVIAKRSARFHFSFSKVGIVPDSGISLFLPRSIGLARAKGLALLAEPLDAETAAEWGLIWECVDDEAFDEVVAATAQKLAAGATAGLAMTKDLLNDGAAASPDQQMAREESMQRRAGQTGDYREGIAAFLEKRAAKFRGH